MAGDVSHTSNMLKFVHIIGRRAAVATPFLKWAGGKTQLVTQLETLLPRTIEAYMEPFVGGGAFFFYLQGQGRASGNVTLADINPELINAYQCVRDDVEALIEMLDSHKRQHSKDYYYRVRSEAYQEGVLGAARTLYLNKTGFNGLYRLNSRGIFNVPFGSYVNPGIFDPSALRASSEALQAIELKVRNFRDSIASASPRTFLYLDPPYVPISATASFTGYSAGGFSLQDQEDLAACLRDADRRGVRFVLSNSATDTVRRLYDGFQQVTIAATRRINCDPSKRGRVEELAIRNFGKTASHQPRRERAGVR